MYVATQADYVLPAGLLQYCNKIVLEPTKGLRQNAIKILSSTPKEQLDQVEGLLKDTYKKMLFIITFYHAVLNERHSYRSLGWNNHYDFTFQDSQISNFTCISLLKLLSGDTTKVPASLPLMNYVISTLIYGGKISNPQDQMVVEEILKTYFNTKLQDKFGFNLSGLKKIPDALTNYNMPTGHLNKESMMMHFDTRFPSIDQPEIFGIHSNALPETRKEDGKQLLNYIYRF
mgnify:CR=1 FL=1